MRTSILAISLLLGGGLAAQNEQPCCPSPARDCIDCTCFTPAFYDLECDCGFFINGDFLYWYARETNLTYANKVQSIEISPSQGSASDRLVAPVDFENLSARWQPGFRLQAGWNSACDGWDLAANWTWYYNDKSSSVDVPSFGGITNAASVPLLGQEAFVNPWVNAAFALTETTPRLFSSIKAKWRLYFNQLDVEVGRKYWLSSCFNLRPYAGIRSGWTKTRFRTDSFHGVNGEMGVVTASKFIDRFSNRYWGAGPLLGLQPTWYFTRCFAIFSDFSGALLWGDFQARKNERYLQDQVNAEFVVVVDYDNSFSNRFAQVQPILDLAIGVRWERTWCCNRYRTALDLGWEHHVWFDHNHRLKTYDAYRTEAVTNLVDTHGYATFDEATGNLGMGGFVARLRFDY